MVKLSSLNCWGLLENVKYGLLWRDVCPPFGSLSCDFATLHEICMQGNWTLCRQKRKLNERQFKIHFHWSRKGGFTGRYRGCNTHNLLLPWYYKCCGLQILFENIWISGGFAVLASLIRLSDSQFQESKLPWQPVTWLLICFSNQSDFTGTLHGVVFILLYTGCRGARDGTEYSIDLEYVWYEYSNVAYDH